MKALSRYKDLTSEVSRVINAFLSYKNGDTGFYKECVRRWALSDLETLKTALLAFDVEGVRHELYSLDTEPLKRFCRDIEQRCTPLHDEGIFSTESNKELYSLLQDTHGKGIAVMMMDKLREIAHINNIIVGDVCSILDELQPQEQEQPQGEQGTAADEQPTALNLPQELETARRYFERAIDAKYMETTETGGKWLKTQAQLGYFCLKAFEFPRPMAAIRKFFDYGDFSSAVTQGTYKPRRSDLKKWRAEQDKKIFFD